MGHRTPSFKERNQSSTRTYPQCWLSSRDTERTGSELKPTVQYFSSECSLPGDVAIFSKIIPVLQLIISNTVEDTDREHKKEGNVSEQHPLEGGENRGLTATVWSEQMSGSCPPYYIRFSSCFLFFHFFLFYQGSLSR